MNKKVDEYRDSVITHLEYLREKIDKVELHLDRLNGRVRTNERNIYWIFGLGVGITSLLSTFIYLK